MTILPCVVVGVEFKVDYFICTSLGKNSAFCPHLAKILNQKMESLKVYQIKCIPLSHSIKTFYTIPVFSYQIYYPISVLDGLFLCQLLISNKLIVWAFCRLSPFTHAGSVWCCLAGRHPLLIFAEYAVITRALLRFLNAKSANMANCRTGPPLLVIMGLNNEYPLTIIN